MSNCIYSQEQYDKVVNERNEFANEVLMLKEKLRLSEQETLHFHNKYFAEKHIAIEELIKVRNFVNYSNFGIVDDNLIERWEVICKINNQIKELEKNE